MNLNGEYRFKEILHGSGSKSGYRSEYDRDYGRVLHAPSFRRLQNKTQLFPSDENDFFRNRLTHSLEVGQIAESIGRKLQAQYSDIDIVPRVCNIAGLLHDIGHPPFGHNGEAALDECMRSYGGFEGNAQTLRIITRLEKTERPQELFHEGMDCRVGLNLTARSIASILKYDSQIPRERPEDSPLQKGYYESEAPIVATVKECFGLKSGENSVSFKTPECIIMDLADDIAYSTYDIEDAFKGGFLTPFEIMADDQIFEKIAHSLSSYPGWSALNAKDCRDAIAQLFQSIWETGPSHCIDMSSPNGQQHVLDAYRASKALGESGYLRTEQTSMMIDTFIKGIDVNLESYTPHTPIVDIKMEDDVWLAVNVLKKYTYMKIITSPRLKVAENRGKEMVKRMFERVYESNGQLLPTDLREIYSQIRDEGHQRRIVCDFIAGMTDRYAIEFYGRLFSENPHTIYRPL